MACRKVGVRPAPMGEASLCVVQTAPEAGPGSGRIQVFDCRKAQSLDSLRLAWTRFQQIAIHGYWAVWVEEATHQAVSDVLLCQQKKLVPAFCVYF